jgi:hypothetical protein
MIAICALLRPRANILYVTLTGGVAFKNLWPILRQFDEEFELGGKFNKTKLLYELPNKSQVWLTGAQTLDEAEKLRGQAYDLAIIDEGKSFNDHILEYLIRDVIRNSLSDREGVLALIGTPGHVLGGYFYSITPLVGPREYGVVTGADQRPYRVWADRKNYKGKRGFWSFHSWSTEHNIRQPQIWADYQARKENEGIIDSDPWYRRECLGYWCQSDTLSVYRYDPGRNSFPADGEGPYGLPEGHDWQFILGLDLGFHDDTAVVVAAYSPTHDKLYHVYDKSQPHLTFDSILKLVAETKAKFPNLHGCVADTGGLGKTLVESLAEHGHPFQKAEKREKYDHIELVNSDLLTGKIKILDDSHLANEMQLLQWEDETFKREDKRTPNHACDAFLYLWRYAHHHFWRPQNVGPARGTDEWFEEWDNRCAEQAVMSLKHKGKQIDKVPEGIILDGE